jgi:hypothetical protein
MSVKQIQKILVFQQNGSGEGKIAGIRKYSGRSLALEIISIDQPIPPVVDDTEGYLPDELSADLVLDVQFFCVADPSGWDPIHGRSPVHLAGKIHQKALSAALK